MRLPRLLVLTDRGMCAGPLPSTVAAAVEAGARAVVLREKDLPPHERAVLARAIAGILGPVDGTLIVASSGTGAVHLAARDPFPEPRPALVGRSCHSVASVAAAVAEGCDYVTVSPVFPTASKPGYGPALGVDGLAVRTRDAPPVYALGGVLPSAVRACRAAGAHGVAVMGPVMRDPRLVAAYVDALEEELP
ncbi:thiamine phosphate synthase [Asanoa sp. NPDC050611]|uniref:thiamine phosphate synthase n=1 Tax=Asanoa sp. NPDC050611 TaxID=3157098 RepID=UPI003410160B